MEHSDFLALELSNGSVRLSFNTGVDTRSITVGSQLNDGIYHLISVRIEPANTATISIGSCQGICQGSVSTIQNDQSTFSGNMYLGGVRDNTPQIRGHFLTESSFVGCIKVKIFFKSFYFLETTEVCL